VSSITTIRIGKDLAISGLWSSVNIQKRKMKVVPREMLARNHTIELSSFTNQINTRQSFVRSIQEI